MRTGYPRQYPMPEKSKSLLAALQAELHKLSSRGPLDVFTPSWFLRADQNQQLREEGWMACYALSGGCAGSPLEA